ncbi:TPA: chorismate lyase, partial [Klebsiella pneumoniae]
MTDPHSPAWREAAQLPQPLTPLQHDWLFGEDSLTRRLMALSRQTFSVQPLDQGWQPLRDDECQALGVPHDSVGWVRQVYLCGHGRPWVFARSVAARTDLQAAAFDLSRLGERSLGELLFSELAFTRGPFQVCHYPATA